MVERLQGIPPPAGAPSASGDPTDPLLTSLHTLSDFSIGVAYVAISVTLLYFVYRARHWMPFQGVFIAFGAFIVFCGGTHFMHVALLYTPAYGLAAVIQALTVVASVATAIALPPLVPRALALIEAARTSEERKRQLEAAHAELEDLYAHLKTLDEQKTQFFANVSHELRTPLALILGPTEMLLADGGLGPEQRRGLEGIERNARMLLRHVNDLLDVAKLDAAHMEPRYAAVDLVRLVRLSAAHFDGLARERQIALAVETPATLPADLDAEKLQRVLLNLLSNAFKFTPDGGQVACRLEADAAQARIVVEDSGPGVPPDLREVIFERFRQGEAGPTRRFGGTGLGLAIAREFVALHGGTLVVADAPGGGARFTVELPLAAPPGVAVAAAPAESAPDAAAALLAELRPYALPPSGAAPDGRPLVLVVEDNAEMARLVADTLAPEYRVVTAADGQEGMERTLALRPDLVLTDVMMPRLSGDQLVRTARGYPELDGMPIVVLTARADDALRVSLLQAGAQGLPGQAVRPRGATGARRQPGDPQADPRRAAGRGGHSER
jgi:signal transduction histidine kinase/CheY-like chemotaxis protein